MPAAVFVEIPSALAAELRAIVGQDHFVTEAQGLEALSKDYYWYSPILRAALAEKRAAAAVRVDSLEKLRRVVSAVCRASVPITVRGAGTGNYGQAVPLHGGLLVDLSAMDRILSIVDGVATTEPGARLFHLENQARLAGWELRCYPSTWVKATVGGFVGGGSGGIGSITWGGLRDLGTIKRITLLTIEEAPRLVTLEEGDALKALHAYGTNGIMVELQLRLAPKRAWDQLIVGARSFDALLDFTAEIASDDGVAKRLATFLEDPIPSFFRPIKKLYPSDHHLSFFEIDSAHVQDVRERALKASLLVPQIIPHHEPRRSPMLSDYTWNHTTLWAIAADERFTYLQSGFGDNFRDQFRQLRTRFPGEILLHLEFMRGNSKLGVFGKVSCGAIPLVRFKSAARLQEIIDYCTEIGVFTANPHTYYVEEGGRDFGFAAQCALKAENDPHGLLNPGKLKTYPHNPFLGAP